MENIPFYGFATLCLDHPEVQALASRVENRRLVTYGTSPQAEVRATRIDMGPEGADFDVVINPRDAEPMTWSSLRLPMTGRHNVLNALAAIAVARELGMGEEGVRQGPGLLRRGEAPLHHHGHRRRGPHRGRLRTPPRRDRRGALGRSRGADRDPGGKVVAVVQPHRYSRLQGLFTEFCAAFNDADRRDRRRCLRPPASRPSKGWTRSPWSKALRRYGHRRAVPLEGGSAGLASAVAEEVRPGDLVVCLGAGDITTWAQALPTELSALKAGVAA